MRRIGSISSGRSKQQGVTLVELMIALILGLFVLVGLSAVFIASKQAFRFQDTAGRLQEDASFALDTMSRDLRMAGYAGCGGVDAATVGGVTTYYPTSILDPVAPGGIDGPNPLATVESAMANVQPLSPVNFLRGFDGIPSAMFTAGSAPPSGSSGSLFFSGGSSNAVSVSTAMALATSPIAIASDAYGWGSTKVYTMVVSDCTNSSLFAGKLNAAGTQIDRDLVDNVAQTPALTFPLKPNNPNNPKYGVDAIVMPLEWNFYFVDTRSGAATPSLYRVFYDGNLRQGKQELISNVESMRLNYGENLNGVDNVTNLACVIPTVPSNCVPSQQADVWRTTAATVTDWSKVVAVRIGLMMVSDDNTANRDVATAVPPLLGASYSLPAGASTTRLRKEFSTTVVLRNRVAPR